MDHVTIVVAELAAERRKAKAAAKAADRARTAGGKRRVVETSEDRAAARWAAFNNRSGRR